MTNSRAEMAKKTGQKNRERETSGENTDQNAALARRYRQIGISAVAAAARYQGAAKNPAYAPVPTRWRDRGNGAA